MGGGERDKRERKMKEEEDEEDQKKEKEKETHSLSREENCRGTAAAAVLGGSEPDEE